MMASDPLDKNRNWVRAAMGLKYLKEGLESFAKDELVKLQSSFLQDIRSSLGLPPTTTCSLCNLENALPCPTKGYCYKNRGVCNIHTSGGANTNCPNNLCNNIASNIVNQHRYTRRATGGSALNYEAPSWRNTDVSKWCTTPWEIAKCFMTASGYKDKLTAKDTDCPGILSVIINCQAIQPALSTVIDPPNDTFSKMRDIRNKIMHSATLEVTDAELQQYIDDMLGVLNDSNTIQNHPDAMTARPKLNQIKANTFVISSRDELELRKKAVEAIKKNQKELEDQCQQVQHDIETKANQTLASLSQAEISCQNTQYNLDEKKTKLEEKQTELKSEVDQAITFFTLAKLKSKQTIDHKMDSLTLTQTIIEQSQKDLQSKCDQIQQDIETKANQTLASLSQAEISCKNKQDDLEEKLEDVVLKSKQMQSTVDQKMNSMTQTHANIEQNQKELQSKCDQTMTSLAQAERQFKQKQDDIQSNQSQLYLTLTSLQAQMKQVLKELRQCQLDIKVRSDLQKGTDKHEEHVNILEKRQQLQTRLREKYLNHQSTIPILKNMNVDIDIVYQRLVIIPDLIHDPNVESNCSINDYEDIFRKKSGLCKNIFVVGNGGVGKTTWCLKLLRTWLNCPNNSKKDHTFLQRFEYLFYVQLRYTKQASQIHDMIKSYIFPELDERCLMDTVDDVLINKPEKCLIILDGLDEWKLPSEQSMFNSALPYDPTRSRFTTLISSRPWKLEILRLKSSFIDIAVEIKGLNDRGISQFAGHIIDKLNSVRNKHKKVSVFTDCIKERRLPMIEVPLMLSIFVYLWYENDFIGDTLAEFYSKLTAGLLKYAEGDQRKIKQNIEVSKLSDIKNVHVIKKKWSNQRMSLPECINNGSCKTYYPLIYKLGHLAFDGLLSEKGNVTLIFTRDSIEEYINEEELEVALCVGIFSQSQTIGDSTEETFSISFMHKTLQEFFAAAYIVSATSHDAKCNIQSKVVSYCKQIRNVFEIENILIFICGMDPKLAGELTRLISIKYNRDVICYGNIDYHLESLHKVLIRCVREEHLYSNESNQVYIINHFIELGHGYVSAKQTSVNIETFSYIKQNCHRIPMCLYLKCKGKKYDTKNEDFICKSFSEVHTLEKLKIRLSMNLYDSKGCLRVLESIKHLHLQTLQIVDIQVNLGYIDLSDISRLEYLSMTSIQVEGISLPKHGCLKTVDLKSIKHPQGASGRLTFNMNNQPFIEYLTLDDILGNIGHINLFYNSKLNILRMTFIQIEKLSLPQIGCLREVALKCIKHPQGDLGRLAFNMNNQPHLELLTLGYIKGNLGHIDLSNNSIMKLLRMTSIRIEKISLPQDGCLQHFQLKSIKHLHGAQGKLTMNIQRNLKRLTLEDIQCNIGHFDLSNNVELRSLGMTSIKLEELLLPQDGCLHTVALESIKHEGAQDKLTFTMNNHRSLKRLTLDDIECNIGHLDLSNNSTLYTLA